MPTFQQVKSFLRAILSGRDYKLQSQRDEICNACDQFTEHPVKNIWGRWKMAGHCKACGCGVRSLADIRKGKNALRKTKCPLLKWPGDAEDRGLSLRDANALFGVRDQLEYNLATVQNLIDKGKPMDPALLAQIYGRPAAERTAGRADVQGLVKLGKGSAGAVAAATAKPQTIPAAEFKRAFRDNNPTPTRPDTKRIEYGRAHSPNRKPKPRRRVMTKRIHQDVRVEAWRFVRCLPGCPP